MATSTRKSSLLLPQIYQTEKNKKFLSSTIDQLIEPTQLEKLSGYVGLRTKPSYKSSDVFLNEVTNERFNYQLEPTVTYKSDGQNTDFAAQYIDFVNQIESEGGSPSKQDRLFEQESYSYSPPIDVDKFVNYRQYYWLPNGVATIPFSPGTPGATITLDVTNDAFGAYKFNNKNIGNPDIVVYRGNTYNFRINAKGHPFHIKTQPGTGGDDLFDSSYVTNSGTEVGTVTLHVPAADSSTTAETILWYQCQNHVAMVGRLIIKDLASELFDPEENLLGVTSFTDYTGLTLSNGMRITTRSDVTSDYANKTFFIEEVGSRISLVADTDMVTPEAFSSETGSIWDENGIEGFDTVGFDNTTGQVIKQDYYTINRASSDKNAWSRSNKWVHKSIIDKADEINNTITKTSEASRAKRPIIEFVAGLQLFNHGTIGTMVDVVDTAITDALATIQGASGATIDGTALRKGDKIVFTADPDLKDKILTVDFVSIDGTLLIQLLDDSTVVPESSFGGGQSVVAKRGTSNIGKSYHWINNSWVVSQQKTKVNQAPLFDLFDNNNVTISNRDTYVSTNFTGTTIFEIATATQGTPDTIYGQTVLYDRVGLINDLRINDTYHSKTFNYVANNEIVEESLRQYYFFINRTGFDTNTKSTSWKVSKIDTPQMMIKSYSAEEDEKLFVVDHYINADTLTDLTIKVLINGVHTNDFTTVIKNANLYVSLTNGATESDTVVIKAHSTVGTPSNNAYFEVHPSAQRNPLNANLEKLTLGDMVKHFTSSTEEQPDFDGIAIGVNSSRDIPNMLEYGSIIMQHSGSVPLASVLLKDSVMNITKAMRYSAREYEKFKRSIIDQANKLSLDGTDLINLDQVISQINKNKNSNMAFYDTDMLAYGEDSVTLKYTVVDSSVVYYPITNAFNLTTLSKKAVYVYLNDTQLVHGSDYVFTTASDSSNQEGIQVLTSISKNDILKIVEHETTESSFVPATPAKLGLAGAYEPAKYFDKTYQSEDSSIEGIEVVRGHDGSITIAYGDFRDNLLLEFEKRIYNNIKVSHDPDLANVDFGFWRDNEYTINEINKLYARDFYTWSGVNAVDYTTNDTYDSGNDFTYNYSNYINSIDGALLKGYWRNIYKQWFDTDQPHFTPWEMVGFSVKPDWWDSKYGSAPYTKGNTILWKDMADGFVGGGPRKGYYTRYRRDPKLLDIIPVSDSGELLPPTNAGLIGPSTVTTANQSTNWVYGDYGPPETAWRKSSSFKFAEQVVKFLAKPARYAGLFFDYSRLSFNKEGQVIYDNQFRVSPSQFALPTGTTLTAGYINVLFDYVKNLGYTANTYIANRLANLNVQLSYKLGGFSNKDNLQVVIGAVSPASTNRSVFMPKENYDLLVYKSAPIVTANYSGVIVEKSTDGFRISGYSNYDRTFRYFPVKRTTDFSSVVVGATTDNFTTWQAGGFYAKGAIVKESGVFYRAKNNLTSGQTFSEDNWNKIGSTLPLKGGARVKKYKEFLQNEALYTYGTTLKTVQEVADFLYGYNRWLETQGFVFDEFSKELNLPMDWDLSTKEFLFWTTQNWAVGSVITLSPASAILKFKKENTVGDDLTDYDQYYSVLQQDGLPINPVDLSTNRLDGEFTISTNPDESGIYNADIRAVQKEHLLLLDNATSFADIVFDKTIGNRQDRIKIVGFRTAGWNGDIYTPGSILDRAIIKDWQSNTDYKTGEVVFHQNRYYAVIQNHTTGETFDAKLYRVKEDAPGYDLLPNWDAKAESFRDFYSLDTDNFNADQQQYAQHLIGYQPRSYFTDLGIDELTQYKFYQGMIRDKGTSKPITRFTSEAQKNQSSTYDVFEEYAFRVGEYGGHRTVKEYEFAISEKEHVQNKQIYQFTEGVFNNTKTTLNVSKNELLKRPQTYDTNIFETINTSRPLHKTPQAIFQYPMAGYVQPGTVDASVWDEEELLELDIKNVTEGYRVWIANTPLRDWDVKRFNTLRVDITTYDQFDDKLQFTTSQPHGLIAGDIIGITGFNSLADGIYKIGESVDSTDTQTKFTVDFDGTVDSTTSTGVIGHFKTVRINDIDNIETIRPGKGWQFGDVIYVDNGYLTNSGLWKIYQRSAAVNAFTYRPTEEYDNSISENAEFGTSIATSSDDIYQVVGAPGDNQVHVFRRPTSTQAHKLRNTINKSQGNGEGEDKFGTSVAMTDDGLTVFAGAPNTGDIVKITLSDTARTFLRNTTMVGADSGAVGTVLYNDTANDILYVKVTSGNFQGGELIGTSDSSSLITIASIQGSNHTDQGVVEVIRADASLQFGVQEMLVSPIIGPGEKFGSSISCSGDGEYVVIGAPGGPNDSSLLNQGTVYVYKFKADGSTAIYTLLQTLTPNNREIGEKFGTVVKISNDGNTIVVGAPEATDSSTSTAGKVFVFRLHNGIFYENETLTSGVVQGDAQFGTSVAISEDGEDLFVGAPNEDLSYSNSGAVTHFINKTSTFATDGSTASFTVGLNVGDDSAFNINQDGTELFVSDGEVIYYPSANDSTTPNYTLDGSTNTIVLNVTPPANRILTVKQYQQYRKMQEVDALTSAGFGSNLEYRDNTLAVFALKGDNVRATTFDLIAEDSSTRLSGTTFDKEATNFKDTVNDTGSVQVFTKYDKSYNFDQSLLLEGQLISNSDKFGSAISIGGSSIYVGAPASNLNSSLGGYVFDFEKATSDKIWQTVSTQPLLVDLNNVKKLFGFNDQTKQIATGLEFIDPAKGKIFSEVEKNISYRTPHNPSDSSWDHRQVGQIWYDTSKIKYLWYEQGSLDYRYLNWGKLHPGSEVLMYEWVSSDLTPEQWNETFESGDGIAVGITGPALQNFNTKIVFDERKNNFATKYFYWVANPTILPQVQFRTVTAKQMALSIEDPNNFIDNYSAIIDTNAVLVNIRKTLLNDEDFVIHFETTTDDNQLNEHSEHVMIAKGDTDADIPTFLSTKFHDSLIGQDLMGMTVPDTSLPTKLQYGTLNRPRQTWYTNSTQATESIIKFINDKLTQKPYATLVNFDKLNSADPLPNKLLGLYDIEVDTDVDLTYLDTREYSVGFKVITKSDSNAQNGWRIYEWNGSEFVGTSSQTYDTTRYWSYIDYYKTGYSSTTTYDFVVPDEKTMRSTSYDVNSIIKVRSSYDGNFRLYLKTHNDFEIIGIGQGTIEFDKSLYDFAGSSLGFGGDAYGFNTYDQEAGVEKRFLLEWIRDSLDGDDTLKYNDVFFLGVRIAQLQNKDIDWVFKSSFVKVKNTFSTLSQLPEFQINTADAVRSFLDEVLPLSTSIREESTNYNNRDTFSGDVTDFDNKSYYDFNALNYIAPKVFTDDSTRFEVYNRNPWKQYSDNYKFTIDSIMVVNTGKGYTSVPRVSITGGGGSGATATAVLGDGKITAIRVTNKGSGYTSTPTVTLTGGGGSIITEAVAYAQLTNNKIRSINTHLYFDRIKSLRQTQTNTILTWKANTTYTAGSNIRNPGDNEIYYVENTFTSGQNFDSDVTLSDSSSVSSSAPIRLWSAADRIHAYYSPTAGMAGLIGDGSTSYNAYAQLMTGLEYKGVKILGEGFGISAGYDNATYDDVQYDLVETEEQNAEDITNLDQLLDSKTFTTSLGQRAEDINVVGDAFISEYSANAPEEVVPGGVYDTVDIKVYTKPSDGAFTVQKRNHYGDGSTTVFSMPTPKANTGVRVFVNNNFKKQGSDYVIDYANSKITFVNGYVPEDGQFISIVVIGVAVDDLLAEVSKTGDGSTTVFNVPVTFSLVKQHYVLVNGGKAGVTITEGNDSASTNVTFAVAPDDGAIINIFLFDLDSSKRAYSEVIATTYSRENDSSSFISTISTNPAVADTTQVTADNNVTRADASKVTVTSGSGTGILNIQLNELPAEFGPYHHKAIVEGVSGSTDTNRYRLNPPQIKYYTGDGTSTLFTIPDEPITNSEATITNVEVWRNGNKVGVNEYTIFTDQQGEKNVQFTEAPFSTDTIAILLKRGHDYEIDENGVLSLQSGFSDGSTINNDKIVVTTFTNHDKVGMRFETFVGSQGIQDVVKEDYGQVLLGSSFTRDYGTLGLTDALAIDFGSVGRGAITPDDPEKVYTLSTAPIDEDHVFVTVNKQYLTSNIDYRVEGNKVIIPRRNLLLNDAVGIQYISAGQSKPAIGYRIFKDILNRYHYKRISSSHSTKLAKEVKISDTEIEVIDGSKLAVPGISSNTPGIITVGTERIGYYKKEGNILSQLFRGTLGTGVQDHPQHTPVVDSSLVQSIPYEDTVTTTERIGDDSTTTFEIDDLRLDNELFTANNVDFTCDSDTILTNQSELKRVTRPPESKNELVVTIGGVVTDAYVLGDDSARTITFNEAPAFGVKIRISIKHGEIWIAKSTGTVSADDNVRTVDVTGVTADMRSFPAEGTGLHDADTTPVKFLNAEPTDLSLFNL